MAILVKDFIWRQTEDRVVIRVPLKGVPTSKVDVCLMDIYLKVNFSPFFFEVFLSNAIRENKSICTLSTEEAIFDLVKDRIGYQWETLSLQLSRKEAREVRLQVQERILQRAQEDAKRQAELKHLLKRSAVNQQIKLETEEHKIIDEIRNTERNKAMRELHEWKSKSETKESTAKASLNIVENAKYQGQTQVESTGIGDAKIEQVTNPLESDLQNAAQISEDSSSDSEIWLEDHDSFTREDLRPVPFPRETIQIQVAFTPRIFPTPSRESKKPEEEEWLQKQAAARRQSGFVAEDLRPEECNPDWLKDKGDSFFQVGNYLGAVSAYTHGIKLNPKLAHLYVGRATAQMAMGNFHRAIEDSSKGLELMVPEVQQNREDRAKCLSTRGAALCKLGMARQGLDELRAAFKLDPNNQDLIEEIARVESVLNEVDNDSDLEAA